MATTGMPAAGIPRHATGALNAMTTVARNAAVYTAGNIANAAVPFLLLPILTRVLSPGEYGVIAMFMGLVVIFGAFTGLSVHGAINVRFFDRSATDFTRYIGSCLSILAVSSLLFFIVVWLLREPLASFTDVPQAWVLLAVLVAALNSLVQIRLGLWMVKERPGAYAIFQFARTLMDFGVSLLLVFHLVEGFEGRLWGRTVAICVFGALALVALAREWPGDYRPKKTDVKDALGFGLPLIPHVIGTFLISTADRFVVNASAGIGEAGVYIVAVQIGMGMLIVMDAFNRAFVPWLYRSLVEREDVVLQRIVKGTWLYFALALLAAGVVAIVGDRLVGVIAGAEYAGAYRPLAWIALGQAFNGMYLMVTNYLFYCRKTAYLSLVTLTTGSIGLAAIIILVPQMGIEGAGVAFAIAMFLKFIFTWILSQKVYPMPWIKAVLP